MRSLAHLKIAVIGEGTAGELENWGLYPDLVPEQYDGDHLGEALAGRVKVGEKILIPRARIDNQTLVRRLEEVGAQVTDLPVYDTEYESFPWVEYDREFASKDCWAMFTSASTVRGFVKSAGDMDLSKVTAL